MHTAQNLQITRPGSFRMFAAFSTLFASALMYFVFVNAGVALELSETEQTSALVTIVLADTLALYWAITGWRKLRASKSWNISRADALVLASYLQDSNAAKDLIRKRLQEAGKDTLQELTYEEVEELDSDLKEAKENEILAFKS